MSYELPAVEHGTSRSGRWLREKRLRIALWIAVIEVVIAALSRDVSRWTIIVLAIVFVAAYFFVGRERRGSLHQISWIAAASQALALFAVAAMFIIGTFVLILAGVFA